MNPYFIIILVCLVIISSFFFTVLSKKSGIPSVLMLLVLGMLISLGFDIFEVKFINVQPFVEIFGIVGLIMIVLEAALDLELKHSKRKLITRAFLISVLQLLLTAGFLGLILRIWVCEDWFTALLYAIPLSIMSSAIIIPSVSNLSPEAKEDLTYESAFSDILGIMFFYFLLGNHGESSVGKIALNISTEVLIMLVISLLVGFAMIWLVQNIKSNVKLFLLISILLILYSVGKLFHVSSLIIILLFGLILKNYTVFFRGRMSRHINKEIIDVVYRDFNLITIESSFVIRTLFFVVFGMTISLAAVFKLKVIGLSLLMLVFMYAVRLLVLWVFFKGKVKPHIFIAPRGLITILLFYSIPKEFQTDNFEPGILLFVIIFSALIMTYGLIKDKRIAKLRAEEEEMNDSEAEFEELT